MPTPFLNQNIVPIMFLVGQIDIIAKFSSFLLRCYQLSLQVKCAMLTVQSLKDVRPGKLLRLELPQCPRSTFHSS